MCGPPLRCSKMRAPTSPNPRSGRTSLSAPFHSTKSGALVPLVWLRSDLCLEHKVSGGYAKEHRGGLKLVQDVSAVLSGDFYRSTRHDEILGSPHYSPCRVEAGTGELVCEGAPGSGGDWYGWMMATAMISARTATTGTTNRRHFGFDGGGNGGGVAPPAALSPSRFLICRIKVWNDASRAVPSQSASECVWTPPKPRGARRCRSSLAPACPATSPTRSRRLPSKTPSTVSTRRRCCPEVRACRRGQLARPAAADSSPGVLTRFPCRPAAFRS